MRYQVGDHVLDEATRTLTHGSSAVHLEPQVFDVLRYLLHHRERAIAKTELLDEIWGDQFVSESALTSRIKSARAALGDTGRDQRHIRTLHGFGYQFVSPVVVDDAPADQGVPAAAAGDRSTAPARALPVFHSPFHGRDQERAELATLVADHRLVTLLGPGGIGKTRLAVEVVASADATIANLDLPALFVDLAATRDDGAIPDTIAIALGIEIGQRVDPTDAVCEFLAAIPHLVIVDNCEHVLAAAAEVIAEIVARTVSVRVLATSRMPLGIAGERIVRLGPLPVVGADDDTSPEAVVRNPAAAIFLDRARLADADLLVAGGDGDGGSAAADAARVAELCRALDGVPLAIELAAGRVAAFGLADLVGLLDRRLDVIGDRSVVRDERHRTLRATVEWSYELLDDAERRLFRTLSVFPGGVTIGCIEEIADRLGLGVDGLDAAGHLVDASLLMRERATSGTRYSQLETLRTFGLDRLDELRERAVAEEILLGVVSTVVANVDAGMRSPDDVRWIDLLREEFPNVRAARRILAEGGRVDELAALLRDLMHWALPRDANEVWAWSDDFIARIGDGHPLHAAASAFQSQAAWRRGDIGRAWETASAALGSGEGWIEGLAFGSAASALLFMGDHEAGESTFLAQSELSDPDFPLSSAALCAAYQGRFDAARAHLASARRSTRGSVGGRAWIAYCTAEVGNAAGVPDVALLEQAIADARTADAPFVVGVATVTLASIHASRGDVLQAAERYEELVGHWLRSGSWTQLWTTLRHAAALLEESDPETALAILRAAAADPLSASAVVGTAADDEAALVARLVERAPADAGSPIQPRLELAERARRALGTLADERER